MQIQKYITSKRVIIIIGISFILITLISLYTNYRLLKAHYVIGCKVNGKTVARFISKEVCGELAQNKTDALELARRQFIQDYPDLFTN